MNSELFEKNLKAMEKWYPDFAAAIRSGTYEKDEVEIVDEYSLDGNLIYQVKRESRSLYLNGKRNTEEPLQLWIDRLGKIEDYAPIVLLGLGSGLYLKKLICHTSDKVNVVVYEPSMTIFLRTLQMVDLEEEILSRPIAFIVEGLNINELEPIVEKLISLETMAFLRQEIHPNYQELFPEMLVKVLRVIENRTDEIMVNQNTGVKFSTVLVRNELRNMKFVCEGYNTRKLAEAIPHDVPAVLVAAGPSLNNDLQELKKLKGKAFILAVDTAVKPLLNAGIVPDAFITIDSNKVTDLVKIEAIKDTPVIAPVSANYYILEQQRGKKIFYFDGYVLPYLAYQEAGKILPDVSTGGSVACSGFSLLYKMGFETIILVGQDLAYTNNKSHADGTFQDIMPEENTENMLQVKGNYEEKVPTRTDFKIYIDWFNMYIKGAKEHGTMRVINATSGGAYLEGTELMPLKSAREKLCTRDVDFETYIDHMESDFSAEDRKKVIAFLHSVPEELNQIKKDAKALTSVYKKILSISKSGRLDKEAYLKQLKKAKKLRKKCESKPAYQLVSATMALADYVVRSESLFQRKSLEEEAKTIATQGVRYCKMLEDCATLLKNYAEETLLPIE